MPRRFLVLLAAGLLFQTASAAPVETGASIDTMDAMSFTAPKEKGTAIIFPSFALHRVTPVTSASRSDRYFCINGFNDASIAVDDARRYSRRIGLI